VKVFYSSKYFIALILASLVLGSCAPKPKKSEATLKLFSSFSATGLNMNGGAVIYGQTKDGASSFSRVFKGASEFTVDINYGDWDFAVVTYAGGSGELTGARECGVAQANISRDQAEVQMTVAPGACVSAGVRGLRLKPCLNANFTTVRTSGNFAACGGVGGDGGIQSYMIAVKPHDNNFVLPGNLLGPCIEAANFEDPPIYIPTGITGAARAPLIIRGFSGAGCTGVQKTLDIKGSLNDIKIADLFFAQASGGGLIDLAINLDGPGLDTTAPSVSLITSNSYDDGTHHWINNSNQASYSVSGGCEDGIPVVATLNGSPVTGSPFTCSAAAYTFNVDFSAFPERSTGAPYNFIVSQTDVGGNTGSENRLLYKDTIIPNVTATLSNINIANQNSLNISGGCDEAGATISGDLDSLAFPSVSCNGTSWNVPSFDVTSVADSGTATLTVDLIDRGGNTAIQQVVNAIKDTAAPAAPSPPLFHGGVSHSNSSPITSSWTSSSSADVVDHRVEVYGLSCAGLQSQVSTGAVPTSALTTPSIVVSTEGPTSIKVFAIDAVGNETSSVCSNNVTYDVTPPTDPLTPVISQTSPTNDSTLDLTWVQSTDSSGILNYIINFYSDPACSVLKDTPQNAAGPNSYTTTPLSQGNTYIKVTAIDNASNSAISDCSSTGVTTDTTKKRASTNPWTYSAPNDVNVIDVKLRRNTCSGDIVESRLGISKALNSATFDFPMQGAYFYEVTAYDLAGNSSDTCSSTMIINQNAMSLGGEYIDGFEIDDTHLYALTDTGLEVYDIGAAPAINKTATLRVEGFAPKRAAVRGDHIYLYSDTEMYIWSTTSGINKANPVFIGKANLALVDARDHAFSAGYMWITSGTTLYAIDLANPGNPALNAAHTITPAQINCKTVEYSNASGGNYIYVACNDEIYAYDIATESSPGAPTVTSFTEIINDLRFDSTSGHMYATGPESAGHLKRLDVRSPFQDAPAQINLIAAGPSNGNTIGNISGALISVCKSTAGTADMINIATLATPPIFSRKLDIDPSVICNRSIMSNGHLFAFTDSGIHVTSTGGGLGPVFDPNPYFHRKTVNRIAVSEHITGTVAFSADRGDHAIVYDLSSFENPKVAHTYTSGNYRDAVFDGATKTVVTIRGDDILQIDLTTPSVPSVTDTIPHGGSTDEGTSLAVDPARRHVFYGNRNGEIRVFNLDTGATVVANKPACLSGPGDEVLSMLYKDNFLFFTCKLSLKLLSYTADNPAVIFNQAGSIDLPTTPSAGGIAHNSNGDFLYVPLGATGIQIATFAVSGSLSDQGVNPRGGGVVNSVIIPNGSTEKLFAGKQSSLESFDINDPTNPSLINSSLGPGQNKKIVPVGTTVTPDYVYSAAGTGGIQVYRVTEPSNIHQ
jgi:hypothetical protein